MSDNKEVLDNQSAETTAQATAAPQKKVAVSRKDMTKWQWTWKEMKNNWAAYLMILPYLFIFILFTVFPVVLSIIFSFTDFNMLEWPNWVGISNYISLFFDDDIFIIACKNTLIFSGIVGPTSYIMAILVAWFINELAPKIRSVVTLIFYAPSIANSAYLIFKTAIFSSDSYGLFNSLLMKLGIVTSPVPWFEYEKAIMPLVIIVALWTSLGTSFLSNIAGLQGIDKSYYEAGAVDGVRNRWQELWYITLPSMKGQLMFSAIMSITGAFGFGDVVTQLCGFPSVNYCAHTIIHHLQDYGSQRYEMGYSSAIAVVLFLIMIGANMLVSKLLSKVGQ